VSTSPSLVPFADYNSILDGTKRLSAAGVNRTYLTKLEKGASHPGMEIIAKLATVLTVEPGELLRLSGAIRELGGCKPSRGSGANNCH
jgi:transcriptional regulator with XRE-family HTH domain